MPEYYATFRFMSEPGDFIGQGQNNVYSSADSGFKVRVCEKNSIEFTGERDFDRWSVEFAAPKGQALKVGDYKRAIRYPFQPDHQPGFSMSGNGRGSNHSFAVFIIDAILIDEDGDLAVFWAKFAQRSEHLEAPTLLGEIYYTTRAIETPAAVGDGKHLHQVVALLA
jgi:hypothetical protein